MTSPQEKLKIYTPSLEDRQSFLKLLNSAQWSHEHLDWFKPVDLLGKPPFLMVSLENQPIGCLACPPDPPTVAWIRLFVVAKGHAPDQVWDSLWPRIASDALEEGSTQVVGLATSEWMAKLLIKSGFREANGVIFYEWKGPITPPQFQTPGKIRRLQEDDLTEISILDSRAFDPIWGHSIGELTEAFHQSSYASAIEIDGLLVAYQLSTVSTFGAHIARLAVDPDWQQKGLGKALVSDTLRTLFSQGIDRVTVNTQLDNKASQYLYQGLGFQETGQRFPVFRFNLMDNPSPSNLEPAP